MLEFHNHAGARKLRISDAVLSHLRRYRQYGSTACEAGGQLFARFGREAITIELATGPRIRDKRRTRFSFAPSRRLEVEEIKACFIKGLHFVGDWHTHPEGRPNPSLRDLASMAECYRRSRHDLDALVMIIVGTDEFPHGLWIGLHAEKGFTPLLDNAIVPQKGPFHSGNGEGIQVMSGETIQPFQAIDNVFKGNDVLI